MDINASHLKPVAAAGYCSQPGGNYVYIEDNHAANKSFEQSGY